ncbi:MAG TPA: alpha-hydroxy acid oxidase [Isosphaeraceae bacterium]|nr:alpha-hydroxy acid oxidase [Isosphaeraceae bacterium]
MKRNPFVQFLAPAVDFLERLTGVPAGDTVAPPARDGNPVNVNEFQILAKARLPAATFEYVDGGSADEVTLAENVAAFRRLQILPPLLMGVASADPSTTVLNQPVALPVLLAPVAAQRLYHPQGALAAARAAAAAGTVFAVSSSAGHSAEEIAATGPAPRWFQIYMPRDRAVARRLVERVEAAGYQAIIITVDLGEWKDKDKRNRFTLPKEMLVKQLRDAGYDQVTERMSYPDLVEFNQRAWHREQSWDVFDWLRSVTKLPLIIKGVLRREDARKAVALGLDGVIVSNHGGRSLDGMPASITMLPGVVEAVGGRAEVYLDGGVRRGTDVLKALALGARAVLIGRPYAWALAVSGEEGVRAVLDLLREELCNAMTATGCARTSEISSTLVARTDGLSHFP